MHHSRDCMQSHLQIAELITTLRSNLKLINMNVLSVLQSVSRLVVLKNKISRKYLVVEVF